MVHQGVFFDSSPNFDGGYHGSAYGKANHDFEDY